MNISQNVTGQLFILSSVAGTRLGARCIEKGDRVALLRLLLTSLAERQSR